MVVRSYPSTPQALGKHPSLIKPSPSTSQVLNIVSTPLDLMLVLRGTSFAVAVCRIFRACCSIYDFHIFFISEQMAQLSSNFIVPEPRLLHVAANRLANAIEASKMLPRGPKETYRDPFWSPLRSLWRFFFLYRS